MANAKKITEIAHEIASNDFGYENAQVLMEQTRNEMGSGNGVIRNSATQRAAEFTSKLTLLLLYQELENDGGLGGKYAWASKFNAGRIPSGNSKQYEITIPTGFEPYQTDAPVYTHKSKPIVDSTIISMYERNAQGADTLSANAYQFNKPITIQANEWIPYFKEGNLSKFISHLTGYMRECYNMMVIQRLHAIIKALNPYKTLVKTETDVNQNNLFLSMVNDIIPTIEDMKFYNSDYNYENGRGCPYALDAKDIVIVCNYKILTKLRSGVMSRVFHSEMINPTEWISDDNWIGLNKELTVPSGDNGSNEKITTGNEVIDENTMYIFDKDLIKHLIQVEEVGNQTFINNMTIQHNLHVWGVFGTIPWKKCIKYTNPNLSKQPN